MPGPPPWLVLSASASHSHKRRILVKDRLARLFVEDQRNALVGEPEIHSLEAGGVECLLDFALTFRQAVEEQEAGPAKACCPSPLGARPASHFVPLLHP